MAENSPLSDDIFPYDLGSFFDHESIWRIEAGSPLQDQLIEAHETEPTDHNHLKASKLIESSRYVGEFERWDNCIWSTTPGYGNCRIEGIDQFLIVRDPDSNAMIVLHENYF